MRFALLLALLVPLAIRAADAPPDPAKMQAAMEQMSKTGAEHAALAKDAGEWEVQSTMWMAPGAPPMVSKGTASFAAVLDGKWIRQDYAGELMGKPYLGVGMTGYDTVAKHYVATWLDNASTALAYMTGESSDGGKTITYTSSMPYCPVTGGPISMRSVLVHESPDKMVFTMYQTPQGAAERKGMELVYTRAKR